MEIKNEIIRIFDENGVDAFDKNQLDEVDSIQYISIIVEVEQFFQITLPDEILIENKFSDFEAFVFVVKEIIEEKGAMLSTEHILNKNEELKL